MTDPDSLSPSQPSSLWFALSGWLFWGGIAISALLLPAILFSRKLPQAKTAWILAVVGFPYIGALFYVTFGKRDLRRRLLRIRSFRAGQTGTKSRRLFSRLGWSRSAATDMSAEAEKAGAFPPIAGNDFALLSEGEAAFQAGREAIESASHHVHLVTYIFRSDATGRGTLKLLADAAKRGVNVRVLYDGAGTLTTRNRFFEPIRQAGGHVASFLPIAPWIPGWRLNLRNHRKLLIVDGALALTGGMNIGDEYHTERKWRDVHAQVRGPVVTALQRVFAEDWHFATGQTIGEQGYFDVQPVAGDVPIQVVASGPDQADPVAPEIMFGAIAAAKTSVDIVTPYLIPTEPIEQALRSAARRGRRVRILVPEFIDHRVVRLAADSYLAKLIDAGVEVWRHPHMIHGKLVIVDNAWLTLGSTNLDARSLWLNFELNISIPHEKSAATLTRYFEGELAASRRLAVQDLRAGAWVRIARGAAHLLAPLL